MSDVGQIRNVQEDLVLSETIAQFEVLVFYLTTVGNNAQPSTELSDRIRLVDKAIEENSDKSHEELFRKNLDVLTTSIVRLCKTARNVLAVLEKLVIICETFTPLNDPVVREKKKIFGSKKEEEDANENETFDNTIDCYILQTMRKCFEAYLSENAGKPWLGKVKVSSRILDFCYNRITANRTPSVRHQAALLLGVFSKVQLEIIVPFFLTKFETVGKKEAENVAFVVYQSIMKYLDWSVEDSNHAQTTINYLTTLRAKLPNIKNGTRDLFPHISSTLDKIYYEILTGTNYPTPSPSITDAEEAEHIAKRNKEWIEYSSNSSLASQFWQLFKDLYTLCSGFAKSSKHLVHMTGTLQNMLTRSPEDFYFSKKPAHVDDLMKLFLEGIKDKKTRFETFDHIKDFIKYLPIEYIVKDLERFGTFIKKVNEQMFNKSLKYTAEECLSVEHYLVEFAKKQSHYFAKTVEELLEQPHTQEQKAVALRSLADVAKLKSDDISAHNTIIGPVVGTFITDEKKRADVMLLRAVLQCFPRVKNPNEERMKEIRKIIGECLLHSDSEVAANASKSLRAFVQLDPKLTFVEVLNLYVNTLVRIDTVSKYDSVRLLNDLNSILEEISSKIPESSDIIINSDAYLKIRKEVEGMLLIWICHNCSEIRDKAIQVLRTIGRDELRAIVQESDDVPYIIDIFGLPSKESIENGDAVYSTDGIWVDRLKELALEHAGVNDAIQYAWAELHKRWNYALISTSRIDDATVQLTGNFLRFLCLSIRDSSTTVSESFLHEVIAYLQQRYRALNDNFHTVVLDALTNVHPSVLPLLMSQIATVVAPRAVLKEKKKERIEAQDPLYEKNVLVIARRILSTFQYDILFHEKSKPIRDFYEELITTWTIKEKPSLKDLPGSFLLSSDMWLIAVEIVSLYLKYLTQATKAKIGNNEDPKLIETEATLLCSMMQKWSLEQVRLAIFNFVQGQQHPEISEVATLRFDITVVNTIKELASLAIHRDPELTARMIDYFQSCIVAAGGNVAIEDAVVDAMTQFLQNNPSLIRQYITNTYAETLLLAYQDMLRIKRETVMDDINTAPVTLTPTDLNVSPIDSGTPISEDMSPVHTPIHLRTGSYGAAITKKSNTTKPISKMSKKEIEEMDARKKIEEQEERAGQRFLQHIPNINCCYLRALTSVMQKQLGTWALNGTVSLGTLLFLALIHMQMCTTNNNSKHDSSTPTVVIRNAAHRLMLLICENNLSQVDQGKLLSLTSTDENDDGVVCQLSVERYSNYIAPLGIWHTADLLLEADRTIDVINEKNRANMLRVLRPWLFNYGKILDESVGEDDKLQNDIAKRILNTMYSITIKLHDANGNETVRNNIRPILFPIQLHTSNSYRTLLADCWLELMRSQSESIHAASEVVSFLLHGYAAEFDQYRREHNSGSSEITNYNASILNNLPISSVQRLLRYITVYIARDLNSTSIILEKIIAELRSYDIPWSQIPKDKAEFLDWHYNRGVDTPDPSCALISHRELSALHLLVDLSYEHDVEFVKHLPKLFINCVVLFTATQNDHAVQDATILLENLFQSLVIRNRSSDAKSWEEAIAFKTKYFRTHDNVQCTKTSKYSRDSEFIKRYIQFFSDLNSFGELSDKLHIFSADIADLALPWAIKTTDRKISLESFYLYYHTVTAKHYEFSLLETLRMCLFESIRVRNDEKISIIIRILCNTPVSVMILPQSLKLLSQIAFWLFFSWNRTHFIAGLNLLLQLQSLSNTGSHSREGHVVEAEVLNSCMFDVWKGYTDESVDVSVSRVIFKGLTHRDTFSHTLALYENLVRIYCKFMDRDNLLTATVLIVQAVLFGAGMYNKSSSFYALLKSPEHYVDQSIANDFITVFETHEQSFRTPSPLVPLNQSDAKYEQRINQFAESFAETYRKHFSNKSGNYVMWLLCKLLMNGEESWHVPSLVLLSHLMPIIFQGPKGWTIADFAHLSHMTRECMIDENPVFVRSAELIMEFLQSNLNVPQLDARDIAYIFVFMKPIRGYHDFVRAKQHDVEMFVGAVPKEKDLARAEMLRRMWAQAFDLEFDRQNNQEQSDLLNKMIQYADEKAQTFVKSPSGIPITPKQSQSSPKIQKTPVHEDGDIQQGNGNEQ